MYTTFGMLFMSLFRCQRKREAFTSIITGTSGIERDTHLVRFRIVILPGDGIGVWLFVNPFLLTFTNNVITILQ